MADVCGVGGVVEEVGVGVESDAGAGVAEDAADLGDVEFELDDQVAGEGVAEVVDAEAGLLGWVVAGVVCCAAQSSTFGVARRKWRAARAREHVVVVARVGGGEFVPFEQGGELGGGAGCRRWPPGS